MQTQPSVDDAARAVLDGTPLDWPTLESTSTGDTRGVVEQLKVLSALAEVHRSPIERHWGHLKLLEKVGAGAFGEVFRAWDTRLDREVALKLLPAGTGHTAASPVIEEGRLLARVRHHNVATIYGAESLEGRIGLWMEFVHGQTLEALLRSGHQFSVPEILRIGADVVAAVSAVHAAGLLHRDIKAQNVMRGDDGRVVLMDFGTGQEVASGDASAAGTPLYLAPEALRGDAATISTDIYSIGVLLYHLLTGGYPVTAQTIKELQRAHESGRPRSLGDARPDLPGDLVAVIDRAIDPDPLKRFETCDAFGATLRALARQRDRRRWLAGGAAAAVVVLAAWALAVSISDRRASHAAPSHPVILVVPFKNGSTRPDSDLVVDGLTYELIRDLAVIDGLEVRSATSSFAFKGKTPNLADIRQRLGATLVLEGSVQESEGTWRVHAQLASVSGDQPVWTDKFDRRANDLFNAQDDIALAVVNALRLSLGKGQRRYTISADSSKLYLQARTLVERRGAANASAAIPLFEQVIASDPTFAPAYAGLASAYAFLSQDLPDAGGIPPQQAMGPLQSAAEKALSLDPLLAEAHAAMGLLHARQNDWAGAQQSFDRAIATNPGLISAYMDYALTTLMPLKRFEEAERVLREALRRDPGSAIVLRDLGSIQLESGRYPEAIATFDRAITIDSRVTYLPLLRARALSLGGRIDQAMPFWNQTRGQIPFQAWMAYAFVHVGRRAEVEEMAAVHKDPYRLTLIYAALGDTDRALTALEQAAVQSPQRVVRLLVYPELAALRREPRFAAVRARFQLPE